MEAAGLQGRGEARVGAGVGRLRPPAAPALKFHGRCSSYKGDAGCARGTRGREAADECGEEFARGGACGAPPVLRREPGHKEPSALAPQDRGPEVSRHRVLAALPASAPWARAGNSLRPRGRGRGRGPGTQAVSRGWQRLPGAPLICWMESVCRPHLSWEGLGGLKGGCARSLARVGVLQSRSEGEQRHPPTPHTPRCQPDKSGPWTCLGHQISS